MARAEDESTGYVLSRSLLQKLAMQLPTTATKVKSLCNTRCSHHSSISLPALSTPCLHLLFETSKCST